MIKNPAEHDGDIKSDKFYGISGQPPASLPGVRCNQRALVEKSRMTTTQ
jgi:hypothetical protein